MSIYHFKEAHFVCNTLYFDRDQLNDLCLRSGFQPRIVRVSNEQEFFDASSFDFGDNVTVCPLYILPYLTQVPEMDLQFTPLGDAHAVQQIYLVRHRERCRTDFIPEFAEYTREVITEHLSQQNAAGQAVLDQSAERPVQ